MFQLREDFVDTKETIRIRKSKKDRQHNGEKDQQRFTKHTHKTKDRVTRTPLITGGELVCSSSFLQMRSVGGVLCKLIFHRS